MPEIRVKHGATTHTVDLAPGECPYKRIGALLSLPPTKMTIIRAGKKLPPAGDAALASAILPGALYLVSGTRAEDALPSRPQRWLTDATDTVTDFYSRFTWDFFIALLLWLWQCFVGLGRASISFVTSMVIAPDPERADRHARPAAVDDGVPPLQ